MRLSEFEILTIRTLARHHFGKNVHVLLFGSRTRDLDRGGDIDLYISHPGREELNTRTKINFITDLILQIGDQKVDVVLDKQAYRNSSFIKTIHQNGIKLC